MISIMNIICNDLYRASIDSVLHYLPESPASIFVTGATGLIGSCCIDLLTRANELGGNYKIFAASRKIDRLKERFCDNFDGGKLYFIEYDVRNSISDNLDVDYVIHGASNADPQSYALNPVETLVTNVMGIYNMMEYCKKHPRTRLVLLSTFEVYGNKGHDIYKENDYGFIDQDVLRNCYPESKRCSELLLKSYVDEYKVNANIARLCSIYGPTMLHNDSKAHAQFIRNGLNGKNIELKSAGLQKRTYCYVIDAVSAILEVLCKGRNGEAYNISYEGSVCTIKEVAETVARATGTEVIFADADNIESKGFSKPQNCILDNYKLKSLGWNGHYSLEKGIKETIAILNSLNAHNG